MIIQPDTIKERESINSLIQEAFRTSPYSNHKEQLLVEQLQKEENFTPTLSLVALQKERVIGYILFSPILLNYQNTIALILAPLVVKPTHQNRGVGLSLIKEGHTRATSLGFSLVFVFGEPNYYSKIGYTPILDYNNLNPFDIDDQYFMKYSLSNYSLKNISSLIFPKPFF